MLPSEPRVGCHAIPVQQHHADVPQRPGVARVGSDLEVAIAGGRIYTTAPESLQPALAGAVPPGEYAVGQPVTIDNYGRVADSLRRDLRVAQVVCLGT